MIFPVTGIVCQVKAALVINLCTHFILPHHALGADFLLLHDQHAPPTFKATPNQPTQQYTILLTKVGKTTDIGVTVYSLDDR